VTPYRVETINGVSVTFLYDAATGQYQATLARPRFESTRIFDTEAGLRRYVARVTKKLGELP